MIPRIEFTQEKKLIGLHLKMNLIQNKTSQLWKNFGPRIKEVSNRISSDKISMQVYPVGYFHHFKPEVMFEKWATVEVSHFEETPSCLNTFTIESGLYAVFDFKGSSNDNSIYQYIFSEWLPNSIYQLNHKPHFEVLGEKYLNNNPNSEEQVWIPIIEKSLL